MNRRIVITFAECLTKDGGVPNQQIKQINVKFSLFFLKREVKMYYIG